MASGTSLDQGQGVDDRHLVAVRLPPGPPLAATFDVVWERGDAVLPIPHGWSDLAAGRVIDELRPATIITAAGEAPLGGERPVEPGTAVVLPTSGTTGRPKGVVLSHAALEASARASLERLQAGAGDRWLLCVPPTHVAGVQVLARSRLLGTDPVLHPRFDVDAIAAERDAAFVSLVPTMLLRLLDAGVDLSRFRAILVGGAASAPALLERAAAAGAPVITSYGMTETSGGCVYDGVPLDGVEVRITGEGRIAIRGPVLMSGYRGHPELTARVLRDGWFVSADLGRMTGRGRLEVLGRVDDVIVTGGENVHADGVAAVLTEHPAVADAAVAGRPDPEWGQRVAAVCVPTDTSAPPELDDLRAWVVQRLGEHAAPRELHVTAELPRTRLGTVDRARLFGPSG